MYRQSGSDCAYSHVTTETLGRFRTGREQKGTTMRNDHVTLRATAVFDLLAPRCPAVPVRVELRYDTRDPYAVVAAFRTGKAGWVEWVFARDLLAEGLHRPTGTGDVRVWPSRSHGQGVVCIALSSPEGEALLEAPARALESFLKRTDAAVPPGTEHRHFDLDTELSHILAES